MRGSDDWTIAVSGGVLVVRARFSVLQAVDMSRPLASPTGLLLQAFGPDRAEDALTETANVIGFDRVEFEFPQAELASGPGLYDLRPTHATQPYRYEPNAITLDLRDTYGLVNDGAPTQGAFVTDLAFGATDDWVNAWVLFLTGNNAGKGPRKITGSTDSSGSVALAFSTGFAQAVADGDAFTIINS